MTRPDENCAPLGKAQGRRLKITRVNGMMILVNHSLTEYRDF
jgi:hypothetical protein